MRNAGAGMSGLIVLVAFLGHALVLGLVSRRLLGAPVGWPRTLLVAGCLSASGTAILAPIARRLGVIDAQGNLGSAPLEVSAVVLTLLLAWTIAVGLAVLVVLEAIVPTGSLPDPVNLLRDLPARQRRARRYTDIVGIAARHGLGGFLGTGARARGGDASRVARSLTRALPEAGVTFVKFGQMMATRPDLVGDDMARELGTLHADVPAVSWPVLRAALEEGLQRPTDEVFAEIEQRPLAAASVGQVHAARLLDGTRVVVKVQRPGAAAQVAADLDILRRLAGRLERSTGWARTLGLAALVEGFAEGLHEELDYRVEAANARAVSESLPWGQHVVHVPIGYPQWSGRTVLVMERIDGVPLSRAAQALTALPAGQRRELAAQLLAVVLRQIVQTGIFHADLHAGNVLLRPDDTMAMLDFGSVGRLDRVARDGMARLLLAVERDDSVAAADALLMILDRPDALVDRALERELGALIGRYRHGLGSLGASGLFPDLFRMVMRHGFTIPPQVAAAFRTLGALEGTLATIDPGTDLVTAARRVGDELHAEQRRPAEVKEALEDQLLRLLPLLERLPRRVDAIAGALESGRLAVRVRLLAEEEDRRFVAGLGHELTMTVVAAAASIAAVLLIIAPDSPELSPGIGAYPLLGAAFLLFAVVLAARVLVLALGSRGRPGTAADGRG